MEHLYEYLARLEHKPRRSVEVIMYNFMNILRYTNTFFITKKRAKRYKGNG